MRAQANSRFEMRERLGRSSREHERGPDPVMRHSEARIDFERGFQLQDGISMLAAQVVDPAQCGVGARILGIECYRPAGMFDCSLPVRRIRFGIAVDNFVVVGLSQTRVRRG